MASLINQAKSLFAGRSTIGISGVTSKKEKETIDLDVVQMLDSSYTSTVSKHPIEKSPESDDLNEIADMVSMNTPTLSMECILSDNLNLASSITSFSNQAVSAKDKLKNLIYFQRKGSLVTIEGYGTGGDGIIGSIISYLDRGISGLFNSDIEEEFYLGTDTDTIENIVINSLQVKRETDIGNDIKVAIGFQRIQTATAQTGFRSYSKAKPSGRGNSKRGKTKESKKQNTKKLSILKGG